MKPFNIPVVVIKELFGFRPDRFINRYKRISEMIISFFRTDSGALGFHKNSDILKKIH